MAIAFDNATDGNLVNPGTDLPWSHLSALGSVAINVHASSSSLIQAVASSYTGVGSVETSTTATNPSAVNFTQTVTTTAANCWTVAQFNNGNGATNAAVTGVLRIGGTGGGYISLHDSNAALSPGSNSLQANAGGGAVDWGGIILSLAPGSGTWLIVATLGDTASDLVTSVTANGSAMAKQNVVQIPGDRFISLWAIAVTAAAGTQLEPWHKHGAMGALMAA